MTAKIDQTPREPRQPKPASCASGTLTPAANDAPTAITAEYRLVINPEFEEKLRLVSPGNNTLPNAMAIPNKNVPKYRAGTQAMDRIPIPTANRIIAPNKVPPIPNLLVNKGVKVDTTPNIMSGKVVSTPNIVFESPVAALISSISGPTLAKAGRRLMAMNRMPMIKSAFFDFIRFFRNC